MPSDVPDALVENHGSIFLVRPVTEAAMEWIEEHAPEDAMFVSTAIVVEHRYVVDFVEGMRRDGLAVK